MLDDYLDDDSCQGSEQQMDEDFNEHVYALTPMGPSSTPSKLIRSQSEDRRPGSFN